MQYGYKGDSIEIVIRDFSGAKIESWKVGGTDKRRQRQIFNTIKKKYNINLFFTLTEKDRDLQWLD